MASRKRSPAGDHGRRRSKSSKSSYTSAVSAVSSATNNMFANDGSFMDMFKRTIASNATSTTDGCGNPYTAATVAAVDGHHLVPCSTSTQHSTSSGSGGDDYHRHAPGEMTSNLRRTLPAGATYAAAATTYVHAGNLIPAAASSWTTFPSAGEKPRVAVDERPMHKPAASTSTMSAEPATKKTSSLLSFVGRRRGGKTLPTGMVKKAKVDEAAPPVEKGRTDAWSQYMAEVRKYKEMSCEDEGKTRPLVK